MQQIIVKEIKGPLGRGEKKFYAVADNKGAEFTTFDPNIQEIRPGSTLEIEVKIEGKYVNIVKWSLIDAPAKAQREDQSDTSNTKLRINADYRIAAVQVVGRIIAAGIVKRGEKTQLADEIYSWLIGRNATEPNTPPTTKPSPQADIPTTTDELYDWLASSMGWRNNTAARSYLVNKCKLPEDKIDNDPAYCYTEVCRIMGWK